MISKYNLQNFLDDSECWETTENENEWLCSRKGTILKRISADLWEFGGQPIDGVAAVNTFINFNY